MKSYKTPNPTVEAVKFDPHGQWPEFVKPWTSYVPRDMTFGYIEIPGGKLHVKANDWIVKTPDGRYFLYTEEVFKNLYEPA